MLMYSHQKRFDYFFCLGHQLSFVGTWPLRLLSFIWDTNMTATPIGFCLGHQHGGYAYCLLFGTSLKRSIAQDFTIFKKKLLYRHKYKLS